MSEQIILKVKIWDTKDVVFEGESDRISSFNEIGPFDIYKMHANFISIIKKKLQIFNNQQIIKELEIGQAVIKVKHDVVHIFLGIEAFSVDEESSAEDKK